MDENNDTSVVAGAGLTRGMWALLCLAYLAKLEICLFQNGLEQTRILVFKEVAVIAILCAILISLFAVFAFGGLCIRRG